jgi:hypothetical protein
VFSTPKLFVVDGERRFVAKQISADQIADLVIKLRANRHNRQSDNQSLVKSERSSFEKSHRIAFNQTSAIESNKRVAVIGLNGSDCNKEIIDIQSISDVLSGALIDKYQIIERTQIQEILKEQKFQMTGLVDEESAVRAGNLIGAEAVVICRVSCIEGKKLYTAKMIDCQTGRQLWSGSSTDGHPTFQSFCGELANQIK